MKRTALLNSDDFSVRFEATGQMDDYGVPGSPRWFEPEEITITYFEFLGVDFPRAQLPDAIEAKLLEEAEGLDWEPVE